MRLFIGRRSRSIVISSNNYCLSFQRLRSIPGASSQQRQLSKTPSVTIKSYPDTDLSSDSNYLEVKSCIFNGLLGLVCLNGDIYVAVISGVQNVGFPRWKLIDHQVRPSESIYKVLDVDFYSLENDVFDYLLCERSEQNYDKLIHEHPCGPLKKLFSDGTFYYSRDFDISNIVKNHGLSHNLEYTVDNQDLSFIWNANLANEVINWRSKISNEEKQLFANAGFLTFVIRGYCKTALIEDGPNTASITIISRISTESKQDTLELEGISEDGRMSLFVETEIVVTTEKFIFSYTQVNGSIPLFWESVESQLLYGKKIKVTKDSIEAQGAFDRHFDNLTSKYGVVSIVNIIKPKSESQEKLALTYTDCAESKGIKITNIEYSSSVLTKSPHKLLYLLKQDIYEFGAFAYDISRGIYFAKQTGVLRISAFDSIEKPNTVERLVSKEVLELTTNEIDVFELTSPFLDAHDKLWSENYYWLDRTYTKHTKNSGKYTKVYSKLFGSRVRLYDPLHIYISQYLKQLRSKYTFEKDISIFAGTFNISGKIPKDDIKDWIFPKSMSKEDEMADLYVIGLEEVVELTPGHMLATDPYVRQFWEKKILTLLNGPGRKKKYIRLWSTQLGGILLLLFMNETEYSKVKHIEGDVKKTGFGGMASNKGAVAVSFKYSATRFCVLVSHLAAGLENVEQRHNDYKTIAKSIRFSKGLRIKDHDAIIWMGDFNYRILMSNEDVRRKIVSKEYASLFEKDQLNQQMIAGESFPYFHEMAIDFPPTYKFDPGTKNYDTSEKMRIPAWTDRILSRGEVLEQLEYKCCEDILFSDHRPVYAIFRARVTVVDEQKKTTLGTQIYEKIMERLEGLDDDEKIAVLSDDAFVIESFEGSDSIAGPTHSPTPIPEPKRGRKLPPPSSDLKKWWIGSGKQVKVVLDVDPAVYMINPKRDPNPFVENEDEPLFIER